MITKTMVEQAYRKGVIKLGYVDADDRDIVAWCGGNYFYFDSETNREPYFDNVELYKKDNTEESIIEKLFNFFEEWRYYDEEECAYYECVMNENDIVDESENEK